MIVLWLLGYLLISFVVNVITSYVYAKCYKDGADTIAVSMFSLCWVVSIPMFAFWISFMTIIDVYGRIAKRIIGAVR